MEEKEIDPEYVKSLLEDLIKLENHVKRFPDTAYLFQDNIENIKEELSELLND